MKLGVRITAKFKKDAERIRKQGKDLEKMYAVIEKLANLEPLEARYRDHSLSGNYEDCRECHKHPTGF